MTLKVWGFAEFLPNQQRVVDFVQSTVVQSAKLYWYESITTCSVERDEVLLKGWEATSKEIYGLYGMATWPKDVKGYGLHFDLTVPFTRYIADNAWSLSFPFKRVQSQQCRRGERPQKWRFREFVQADVDVLWHHADKSRALYEAEVVHVLWSALTKIFDTLQVNQNWKIHINNRNLLQWVFRSVSDTEATISELSTLVDKYYKMEREQFEESIIKLLWEEKWSQFLERMSLPLDKLNTYEAWNDLYNQWVQELKDTILTLEQMSPTFKRVYDPTIVRGLDYYTWVVFETFIEWSMQRWSICSWWRYDNLVQEVDPKAQEFDGVGWSIGVSRLSAWLFEQWITELPWAERVLIASLEWTWENAQLIAQSLRDQWKQISLYPQSDKLGKQYSYAEKSWFTHVIICWPREVEQWIYMIKELATGEQTLHPLPELA